LLFCDNSPYIFEVNYLLENYLTFSHDGRSGRTNVRFGGLPCQSSKGTFNGWIGKAQITAGTTEAAVHQHFTPKTELPAPGKCNRRLSLRPGLVEFFEGNTISYAVNQAGRPISSEADLWPFAPFAWTSEAVSPARPFILFHDPKITSDQLECAGPIVVHGGFTSAFYEFGDDRSGGTGRLIISIACWLTRIEERFLQAKISGSAITKTVPRLTGNYAASGSFKGWRPRTMPRHSILCLDVSGSMRRYYTELVSAANDYIKIQREFGGVISVVLFDEGAKILFEQNTEEIPESEIHSVERGGTNFAPALQLALQVVGRNSPEYECRILFFTDGEAGHPSSEIATLQSKSVRIDVVGLGSLSQSESNLLESLVTCGGTVTIGAAMNDVGEAFRAIAAAD
jgi:hypothetical protein